MRFSLEKLLVAQVALVQRADGHKDAVVVVAEAIEKKNKVSVVHLEGKSSLASPST